ncbi:hypothetical protein [Rossellomorea aquimaris]|uniref:hypothetical protein n=1 Tax=Rossellomorea aquimaris TaxID=189382 RepID=UPI0007D0904B|nr:hypothetical protein [Rossellomorea aquimaris]
MIYIYLVIVGVTVSLIVWASLPFVEWISFSLLFLTLLLSMGYLSFNLKSVWISFLSSFALALLFAFVINKVTSLEIPYSIILVFGLVHFFIGVMAESKRK